MLSKVSVFPRGCEICADVLLAPTGAESNAHGVNRFKPTYIDRINIGIQNPVTNYEIIRKPPQQRLYGLTAWSGYRLQVHADRHQKGEGIRHGYGCRAQFLPLRNCGLLF